MKIQVKTVQVQVKQNSNEMMKSLDKLVKFSREEPENGPSTCKK